MIPGSLRTSHATLPRMGVDAESSDLTARIRAARARLVQAGEVEPARPGEFGQFRRGGVATPAPVEVSRRHRGPAEVVPLDETETRGGAAALAEESSVVSDEEPGLEPETDDANVSLVNEFGEPYDPEDEFEDREGRLPQAGTDPAGTETEPVAPVVTQEAASVPAASRKRRKATGPTTGQRLDLIDLRLTAIDSAVLAADADAKGRGLTDEIRFKEIGKHLLLIEEGLLLIAQAINERLPAPETTEPEKDPVPRVGWFRRWLARGLQV